MVGALMLFPVGSTTRSSTQEACHMIFADSGAWFTSLIPTDPDLASETAGLAESSFPSLNNYSSSQPLVDSDRLCGSVVGDGDDSGGTAR
jgi:hypothetical protein